MPHVQKVIGKRPKLPGSKFSSSPSPLKQGCALLFVQCSPGPSCPTKVTTERGGISNPSGMLMAGCALKFSFSVVSQGTNCCGRMALPFLNSQFTFCGSVEGL